MVPFQANERSAVWLLCLIAAGHVFIYAAAFPFFNNVDEPAHFDLAVSYSHGEIPRSLGYLSQESLQYLAVYSSLQFLASETDFPGGRMPPPLWRLPMEKIAPVLQLREASWRNINHEASQPPLYYLVAGGWWGMEKFCGVDGLGALYGLRFLNLFLVGSLVWLGYAAACQVVPGSQLVRLGVPALIAFLPQTAFYGISNDVLLPVTFGAAFLLLLKFLRADIPGVKGGAAAGLALAAVYLTKLSNLPLLAVSALLVLGKGWQLARAGNGRAAWPALAALALAAAIPMAGWMTWCRYHFGDVTGSAAKIAFLGWTHRPLAEWLDHPLFTLSGCGVFLSGLLSTFWQGEFMWLRQPLALKGVNAVYVILSVTLIPLALLERRRSGGAGPAGRPGEVWVCFWMVAASVLFLGGLSLLYDFHDCFYPSREHPYFTSGRLMLGALIPFLLLVLCGLERLLERVGLPRAKGWALAGLILFLVMAEIATDWQVFFSQYNWFHL